MVHPRPQNLPLFKQKPQHLGYSQNMPAETPDSNTGKPRDPNEQLLEQATLRHRAGDLISARKLYRRVLHETPKSAVAQFRLGLLEMQEGHHLVALGLMRSAAATSPNEIRYQFGMGKALSAMRRWGEAAAAYQRVLELDAHAHEARTELEIALKSHKEDEKRAGG
jgi:tetratricopeptide (TPR) repeat protein